MRLVNRILLKFKPVLRDEFMKNARIIFVIKLSMSAYLNIYLFIDLFIDFALFALTRKLLLLDLQVYPYIYHDILYYVAVVSVLLVILELKFIVL